MASLKRGRGVTLVEVVLATGVAAIFLTAFLVQFRFQQSSYSVAADELRLPLEGFSAASRLFGLDGLSLMYRPSGTTPPSATIVQPSLVRMPTNKDGTAHRQVFFQASDSDPRPAKFKAGGLRAQAGAAAPLTLTAPALVATMSFYSPELFVPTGTSPGLTVDAPTSAGTAIRAGGTVVAHVLGASGGTSGAGKVVGISHVASDGQAWRFSAFSASLNGEELKIAGGAAAIPFSAGGTFVLDLGTAGTLVCTWPTTFNSSNVPLGNSLTYTLENPNKTKRVGLWLKLNASPFSGLLAIRDSFTLRNQ